MFDLPQSINLKEKLERIALGFKLKMGCTRADFIKIFG